MRKRITKRPARTRVQPTSGRGRVRAFAAGGLAVTLAISTAACGSSNSKKASTGPSTTNGSTANASTSSGNLSGSPVVIGTIGDDSGTSIQNPSGAQLAKVAELDVNAHGGIHGRPLKVINCDSQDSPQQAAVCARQLLQDDHAVMLAGVYTSNQSTALYPALEAANTVTLGDLPETTEDQNNPLSFPLLPGPLEVIGLTKGVPASAKKVTVARFDDSTSVTAGSNFVKGLPSGVSGSQLVIPLSTVDFQPYCVEIKQEGAQAVAGFLSPGDMVQFIQTCKQVGLDVTWLLPSILVTPQLAQQVTSLGVKNVVVAGYAGPAYQEMLDDVSTYASQVGKIPDTTSDTVVNAWLGVMMAAKVLNAVSEINGPSIKAYLDNQTNFVTGLTPPLNLSTPGPLPHLPRVFNTSIALGTIQGGSLVVNPSRFSSFG